MNLGTKMPKDCKVNINEIFIIFTNSVTLPGLAINNKLTFMRPC